MNPTKFEWMGVSVTVMIFFGLGVSASRAQEVPEAPKLLATVSDGEGQRVLFLYSNVELNAVHVWQAGQWVEAKQEDYPHEGKEYFLYRVSRRLQPSNGSTLLVNSWSLDGQRTYRHELTFAAVKDGFQIVAKLDSERDRAQYFADRRDYEKSIDPYGFMPLLNTYRASHGLASVSFDNGLSDDARINNSMGSPHAYMGRARVQNWAEGFQSANGVLRGWIASPGHNRNLLDPSIRRIGIFRSGREWTFNGR